jgi:hypothetical protein
VRDEKREMSIKTGWNFKNKKPQAKPKASGDSI